MRLRLAITAAVLVSLLLPASHASATRALMSQAPATRTLVRPLSPLSVRQLSSPRNLDVERAQLRALIRERHRLLGRLAPEAQARDQVLIEGMLAVADAVLAADATALRHRIDRLRIAQARRLARQGAIARARAARARRLAQQRSRRNILERWLVLAAPGALWSPVSRGAAVGSLAWASPASAGAVAAASVAPPLVRSLTALTSWAGLLPATTPLAGATATPAGAATPLSGPSRSQPATPGPTGPQHAASVGDPAAVAPSHGGLVVDSGSGGPAALDAANPVVAEAILTPVPTLQGAPPQTKTAQRRRRRAKTPQATVAGLERRWRAVSAALAQVQELEAWARANPPSGGLTPNDIILSPQMLQQRLDRWNVTVPLTGAMSLNQGATTSVPLPHGQARPSVPAAVLGATLALSATAPGGGTGLAIDGTLATRGSAGLAASTLALTGLSGLARTRLAAPLALSSPPTTSVQSISATETQVPPTDTLTALDAAPGIATGTIGVATDVVTASPLAGLGNVPADAATPSPFASPDSSGSATPSPVAALDGSATVTPTAGAGPGAVQDQAGITATAPLTAQAALTCSLDTVTPTLTVTEGLSPTSPLTMVVTLPATAVATLAPPGFQNDRGALESVLRQGAGLFDHLKAAEAGAMQQYHAQLTATVRLNTSIEQQWYARIYAYDAYQRGLAAYRQRVVAYNAYAHRVHLAQLRHQQWVQEQAAWTEYARKMAAYKVALAARQAPVVPISGTTPTSATVPPLPPKPVMPPFPGPEPPPFSELPPAWPGQPPASVAPPGLEPGGYPLPVPPEAVPPWDGDSPIIDVISYGGMARGVIAAGREEATQAALLADGALDGVPTYQDPIKGIITTYWGGQTIFQSFHPGIDIAAPMYTPIHAAAAGLVTYAGYAVPGQRHYSYGLCVIIQHNAHFSTLYAHMDDLKYGLQVHSGDTVQAGQVIGYVGMTGWTTGPHLHFEIRDNNIQVNPLLLIPNPQD